MITRPLLAGKVEDASKIKFPVLATPKLDGIRVLKVDGKVVTRKFKELPNVYTRELLEKILPDGIDGEVLLNGVLQVGESCPILLGGFLKEEPPPVTFNEIQSQIMRFEGSPDFVFRAFDYVKDDLEKPYVERIKDLKEWYSGVSSTIGKTVTILEPVEIQTSEELSSYESEQIAIGNEGVMIRNPQGKYKCGRSSAKEGILLKIKRFEDSEAEIIGFEEKMHNNNPLEEDEFGLAKRASKKANLVPADTLGALRVRDLTTDLEFSIGTGFDDELRKEIWTNRDKYLGKFVTYKHQPAGMKELPRFPVFKGIRDPKDF